MESLRMEDFYPKPKSAGWKEKIWRSSIGHYGGMFVLVPSEHIEEFKALFPSREMPRTIIIKQVSQVLTEFGANRFKAKFPRSHGVYYEMFFADRSKGLERFENLFPHDSCVIEP